MEWEYVVNETLQLVQEYDFFAPNYFNDYMISLYKEETILNYTGSAFPKADATLKVMNQSIILSKNGGTEPVIYSNMSFSLKSKENGFMLKATNEVGKNRERFYYMRRIL